MTRNSLYLFIAFLVVSGTALALRWYYVATATVIEPIRGDAIQYYSYAWNLLHHHIFSMSKPDAELVIPDGYRAPGYPVLLATWMVLTSDINRWYAGVLMTQVILGSLSAGMTVLLARLWLPLGWASLAGSLVAVWPHSITITECLLSETLYGFLAILAMLLFGWMLKARTSVAAVAAGCCFGLAILANPVFLLFAVLLALVTLCRNDVSKRLALTFAVCALLLPGIWQVRSATLPLAAPASRDRALQTLVIGSWPGFSAAWRESVGLEPEAAREMPPEGREARMKSGRQKLAAAEREEQLITRSPSDGLAMLATRFLASPVEYLGWYAIWKPASLWGWNIQIGQGEIYPNPTKDSPLETVPALRALVSLCHGLNPIIGVGALSVAIFVIVRRRVPAIVVNSMSECKVPILGAVALLFAYVTAVHTLLQSEPRYSIPYRPFEMALAVTAVAWLAAWVRARRRAVSRITVRETKSA